MTSQSIVSPTAPPSPGLEHVCTQLSHQSAELGKAWSHLERRVARVSAELIATRSARLREMSARGALAEKLTALMEGVSSGVVFIDREGRVEEVNAPALEILGDVPAGRRWTEVLDALDATDAGSDAVDAGGGRRPRVQYRELDGGGRMALLYDGSAGHGPAGPGARESRLRDIGDTAARLVHQLRTPLHAATLYLSQLTAPTQPETVRAISHRARARLEQIEQLIDGLLRFAGGGREAETEIRLDDLVHDTTAALAPLLARSGASLTVDCPAPSPVLRGSRTLLENALGNLLDNALKHADGRPEIQITIEADAGENRLSVIDNGPGVDPAIERDIFDPWFTTRTGGTGLGLAVVSSAAAFHGGRVQFSRPEQGGSCFTLIFPAWSCKEAK